MTFSLNGFIAKLVQPKSDKTTYPKITFAINGMHCTSCSLLIDGELEETKGVLSARTHYATGSTVVEYDPIITTPQELKKVIESLGYTTAD